MIEKYRPLFIHLNPASIPEVVAHMQKYLTKNTFVTVEEFGAQFQEYIDDHPEIIKVGSVNGLTGDVVLTSENITMTGGTSETLGTVIGDILEDASATGETVDDLVVDMDAVKSDIVTLENVFVGATEESSGVKGLVPAPANTQTSHYLKATGDFEAIPAREVSSVAVAGATTVEQALAKLNTINTGLYVSPQKRIEGTSLVNDQAYTAETVTIPDGEAYLFLCESYASITANTYVEFLIQESSVPVSFLIAGFLNASGSNRAGHGILIIPGGTTVAIVARTENTSGVSYLRYNYTYIKLK